LSNRGPFVRVLIWTGIGCAGLLALAGGIALGGPGLVAVGVGGLLAGCTAVGLARESPTPRRRSTLEYSVQAVCGTVGALLVLAGIAAVAGGVVAVLSVGATVAVLLIRFGRSRPPAAGTMAGPPSGVLRFPVAQPVAVLTTAELGLEWTRTTKALAGRLDARVRASLVLRREEVLDELERRDPDGFGRWLSAGPLADSDPSGHVRRGPLLGGSAETDAA
jgi:hypothetical protein